jgi:eukaryotic-like serine/threonine-protein kinase
MADSTLIHGRYQLLEQIGRGGMGQVWRARDEALDRQVAVKCLKPLGSHHDESSLKGLRERFRREARVAAGLQHRGITVVHDFGEYDGLLYLVMELLEGRNLSEVLSDRQAAPLPEPEVADIAAQIAAALSYTHGQGIIHRDLKPANILINDNGLLKIVDFGVAAAAKSGDTQLTKTGYVIGSPKYMAPEQILGKKVDQRADIYSLGVILYEMLAGSPPYSRGDHMSVMYQHVQGKASPLHELNPAVPDELSDVVTCAMMVDKTKRYRSMDELRQALAAVAQKLE